MLDLVHPAGAGRWLGSTRRDAGIDEAIGADAVGEHAAKIGALGRLVESQPPGLIGDADLGRQALADT
jgi:hypothetical protein